MALNEILDTVTQALNGRVRPAAVRRVVSTLQEELPQAIDEAALDAAAAYLSAVGDPALGALRKVAALRAAADSGSIPTRAIDEAVAATADVAHALGVSEQHVLSLTVS